MPVPTPPIEYVLIHLTFVQPGPSVWSERELTLAVTNLYADNEKWPHNMALKPGEIGVIAAIKFHDVRTEKRKVCLFITVVVSLQMSPLTVCKKKAKLTECLL